MFLWLFGFYCRRSPHKPILGNVCVADSPLLRWGTSILARTSSIFSYSAENALLYHGSQSALIKEEPIYLNAFSCEGQIDVLHCPRLVSFIRSEILLVQALMISLHESCYVNKGEKAVL